MKQCSCVHTRYVFCCSYSHNVASKGKFIAFVSAQAESDNPEKELKPGIDLLGTVDELFIDTYDRYEPSNDSSADNCFISTVSIFWHAPLVEFSIILNSISMYYLSRVMMPRHTLSPLLWMYFPFTQRSPERYIYLYLSNCSVENSLAFNLQDKTIF